jgi:hypothetical protein
VFDERMALKIRLDQLADSEERVMRELRIEREKIFRRLNELDQLSLQGPQRDSLIITRIPRRRGRKSVRADEMKNVAITLLKERVEPIRGVDLQRQIEEQTGYQIANMTTFMRGLEKWDQSVLKPGRGLYMYDMNVNKEFVK